MASNPQFPAWYTRAIQVVPGYHDLYGREATEPELIGLIERFPVFEWTSYLSRLVTMIAPPNDANSERHVAIYRGISSPAFAERLNAFIKGAEEGMRCPIFVEPQITTLQQLVYQHAPISGTAQFTNRSDLDILCNALLITWDLMHPSRIPSNMDEALAALMQDQARRLRDSAFDAGPRAYFMYQMNSSSPTSTVTRLGELFTRASGQSFDDYLAGGLSLAMKELTRSPQSIAEGWAPTLLPDDCENEDEAKCLGVFHDLRCGTISDIRHVIAQFDGTNSIDRFNLIGVRSKPIVDFEGEGRFVGNLSATLDALFAGIRHVILAAIGDGRIPELSVQDLGKLYGDVFEEYALGLLEQAFGDQFIRIPANPNERRADGIIFSPSGVVVLEIKAKFPRALDHNRPLTLPERAEELQRCGITDAAEQLATTIQALRDDRIQVSQLSNVDWTTTHVIPAIVTMSRMPLFWMAWPFFESLTPDIHALGQACPTARVRFLDVGDIEHLPDLARHEDVPARLLQWAHSPHYFERPFNDFLESESVAYESTFGRRRQVETMRFLIDKFALDQSKFTLADDPSD